MGNTQSKTNQAESEMQPETKADKGPALDGLVVILLGKKWIDDSGMEKIYEDAVIDFHERFSIYQGTFASKKNEWRVAVFPVKEFQLVIEQIRVFTDNICAEFYELVIVLPLQNTALVVLNLENIPLVFVPVKLTGIKNIKEFAMQLLYERHSNH